jgi:hypothetical protein
MTNAQRVWACPVCFYSGSPSFLHAGEKCLTGMTLTRCSDAPSAYTQGGLNVEECSRARLSFAVRALALHCICSERMHAQGVLVGCRGKTNRTAISIATGAPVVDRDTGPVYVKGIKRKVP